MGGLLGRLFKEFTLTLTMAVLISMVVSLTTTPMMCALLLKPAPPRHGKLYYAVEAAFDGMLRFYRATLDVALGHPGHDHGSAALLHRSLFRADRADEVQHLSRCRTPA